MSLKFLSVPPKFLYASILSTDSSFKVSSITGWDGNDLTSADFGTVAYGAFLSADRSTMELFSFDPTTIDSASIDFVARGLPFGGGPSPVAGNKLDWGSGTTVMFGTDTPQVLQWLKDYIDSVAIAGGPNASTIVQGLVQIPIQSQVDAGTSTGGTGAKLALTPNLLRSRLLNDYAVDASGNDDYEINPTIPTTAYAVGQIFTFKAGTANTGPCTLNVSGLGAIDIKKDVSSALVTGDILAGQTVMVQYDSNNHFQVISKLSSSTPVPTIQFFTPSATIGGPTTQFDITNPSGTTFRYTYDGTGTDPVINSTTVPIGMIVQVYSNNFSDGNNGEFTVTGSGTNYFEVTNASGVAENNKILDSSPDGFIVLSQTYTKPANLKYIEVEMVGGGSGGQSGHSGSSGADSSGNGGNSGAYSKKLISAGDLAATEVACPGKRSAGGIKNASSTTFGPESAPATASVFGAFMTADGGLPSNDNSGNDATGGDVNVPGGIGGEAKTSNGGAGFFGTGPAYGGGGNAGGTWSNGFNGGEGVIIITEHYN